MSDLTLYRNTIEFNAGKNAVVFIHGGAWIDPSNTPDDFAPLCKQILQLDRGQSLGLYGVEYRLSPTVKHPTHLYDVVENLYRLIQDKGIDKFHLLGHSVGATLAWQVASWNEDESFEKKNQLRTIQSKLKGIWLVDGIFSVDQLLQEYPSYNYFVSQAFKPSHGFEDPSQSIARIKTMQIHVVHSYQDELLSLHQTQYMCKLLQSNRLPFALYIDNLGLHNQVYENAKLAQYIVDNIKFI